jgi:simple sugar transport system ATP-binding protein
MSDSPPLLQARGLRKTFRGVVALNSVDFTLRRGEVHSLMGENGAGKSTLLKVLTGAHPRDAGQVLLDGKPVHPRSPAHAQKLGISTVYQEINLIPTLSVAENLFLGRQPMKWGRIDRRAMRLRSEAALQRLNLRIDVWRELASYSIAVQQMVAIARALDVAAAKVLILDEPTSSLDAGEVAQLFSLIRRLKEQGIGIVFVTHFMDQVYQISDRITVLRNGGLVGEYEAASLPRLELIAKMMGRELADFEHGQARHDQRDAGARPAGRIIQARGLARRGAIEPFDLDLPEGEVVGLAGLLGSGRTEIARLLFGVDRAQGGRLMIDGAPANITSPRKAIRQQLAFIPEDRKTQGIIPNLTVRENIALAVQGRRGWLRFLSPRKQRELANRYIRLLAIATPDAEALVKNLSGGNQQKVILARWLASDPRLLILDEPTRGIDVGAKAEIQKLILELAAEGKGILFISSELEEVVRCSDRVVVLRDRRKIGELTGSQIDEHSIMRTIAGDSA